MYMIEWWSNIHNYSFLHSLGARPIPRPLSRFPSPHYLPSPHSPCQGSVAPSSRSPLVHTFPLHHRYVTHHTTNSVITHVHYQVHSSLTLSQVHSAQIWSSCVHYTTTTSSLITCYHSCTPSTTQMVLLLYTSKNVTLVCRDRFCCSATLPLQTTLWKIRKQSCTVFLKLMCYEPRAFRKKPSNLQHSSATNAHSERTLRRSSSFFWHVP